MFSKIPPLPTYYHGSCIPEPIEPCPYDDALIDFLKTGSVARLIAGTAISQGHHEKVILALREFKKSNPSFDQNGQVEKSILAQCDENERERVMQAVLDRERLIEEEKSQAIIKKLLGPITIDDADTIRRLREIGITKNHQLCRNELLKVLPAADFIKVMSYLSSLDLSIGTQLSDEIRARLVE